MSSLSQVCCKLLPKTVTSSLPEFHVVACDVRSFVRSLCSLVFHVPRRKPHFWSSSVRAKWNSLIFRASSSKEGFGNILGTQRTVWKCSFLFDVVSCSKRSIFIRLSPIFFISPWEALLSFTHIHPSIHSPIHHTPTGSPPPTHTRVEPWRGGKKLESSPFKIYPFPPITFLIRQVSKFSLVPWFHRASAKTQMVPCVPNFSNFLSLYFQRPKKRRDEMEKWIKAFQSCKDVRQSSKRTLRLEFQNN